MKSMVAMAFLVALMGAVLAGCGESRQNVPDVGQNISEGVSGEMVPDTQPDASADISGEMVPDTQPDASVDTSGEIVQDSEGETAAEAVENDSRISVKYEDNFAVDSSAAKAFAQKVQEAAAQKDLEALAELTAFPVYVGLTDVDVVETKEDFLKLGAETVFTDGLLESVAKADIENLQPSMAGFSISDGGTANINFGVVDGALAINGINY